MTFSVIPSQTFDSADPAGSGEVRAVLRRTRPHVISRAAGRYGMSSSAFFTKNFSVASGPIDSRAVANRSAGFFPPSKCG